MMVRKGTGYCSEKCYNRGEEALREQRVQDMKKKLEASTTATLRRLRVNTNKSARMRAGKGEDDVWEDEIEDDDPNAIDWG